MIEKEKISLRLILTLDYEIHGNGDGSPMNLMVEPTYRLMNLLEEFGAKVVIFADVAEILCFKKYFEKTGKDKFHYKAIASQLQSAIQRDHDVQLHIHSSYFESYYSGKGWNQNWDEYNMAALSSQRVSEMIKISKGFLEDLLTPIRPDYRCTVFRAANWSMMPTENIYKALVENGIKIDSSVYKWGRQSGNVDYDYTQAHSHLLPYIASPLDINQMDENGLLVEYPIYSELRPFWYFISWIRLFRMVRAKFHKHGKSSLGIQTGEYGYKKQLLASFFRKNPWKLDFNQATGNQMIAALNGIMKNTAGYQGIIDVVAIGHSKTFVKYNEKKMHKVLSYANKQNGITFGKFPIDL